MAIHFGENAAARNKAQGGRDAGKKKIAERKAAEQAARDKRNSGVTGSALAKPKPKTETNDKIHLGKPKEPEDDVIRLGGPDTGDIRGEPVDSSIKGQIKRSMELPIGHPGSLKTTALLGTTLAIASAGLAATKYFAARVGSKAAAGASVKGLKGPLFKGTKIDVGPIKKALGLTTKQGKAIEVELGYRRVTEITNYLLNPKAHTLTAKAMKAIFSGKALALAGVGASTLFLGKWGQAESAEPLSIVMRDTLKQAEATGDWSLYEEAKEARDEILDYSKWETLMSNTPFISPFIGIPRKIAGAIKAAAIQDELARQLKIQIETGETDDDKWARIEKERDEKKEQDRINDEAYYKKVADNAKIAKEEQREEDERYWDKIEKEKDKKAEEDRKAEEAYWEAVRKEDQVMKEDDSPSNWNYGKSNLDFGLI